MSARVGVGISPVDGGVGSFDHAAAFAAASLDRPADLVLVFAGPTSLQFAAEGLANVRERLGPRALVGCGAQGVVGEGREIESGGVAIWAATFTNGQVEPFHIEAATDELPTLDGAEAVILLVDPYSFPADELLSRLAQEQPGLPVIGGVSSVPPGPEPLLYEEGAVAGAVGAVLRGTEVTPCVSQGARPIGPELVITGAEGNVIHELASQPALERVQEVIAGLDPSEQALAAGGLLLGIVIDPNKPEYERGDFLIRGLAGADEETGAISVGAQVRVGQTVRLQVRDPASAHDDLIEVVSAKRPVLGEAPPAALLFTCNGRGSHMFGRPGHDVRAIGHALSGATIGGFFCAGEIGPVGNRSFLHGFTATLALFPGAPDGGGD